jgi:hypothetical protein
VTNSDWDVTATSIGEEGMAMTSREPADDTDEVVSTPATPGAQALPTTDEDEDDDRPST